MKDELTGAIKYDGFKKAGILSEIKAKVVLRTRKKVFRLFIEYINPCAKDDILDAGVAPVKGIAGVKTVTNNFFEAFYPYTEHITATSIEDASNLEGVFKGLSFVKTEPYHTPFSDKQFDAVFCNAVVEHTGSREQQKAFIREYCRVGKKFFFTTPNRWFPIEVHSALPLVHWLPPRYFRKVLRILGKEALADESILNLLTEKEFKALFPKNVRLRIIRIRTAGFVSNLIICGEWKDNE
ncbi:MAG: class I SAM-dependent methyltransferase [Lachnospiraceae bacterium]|nr:class I SAM-dependent methyltransferase [Lachnospiraceae bacterium]